MRYRRLVILCSFINSRRFDPPESDFPEKMIWAYRIFSAFAQKAGSLSGRETVNKPNSLRKGTGP